MARDLADVIHHLLPELSASPEGRVERKIEAPSPLEPTIIAVPLAASDVVRAAFVWNLAIELARRGSPTTLLSPAIEQESSLWPERDRGVLRCETRRARAKDLTELAHHAEGSALDDGRGKDRPIVLTRVPPRWIDEAAARAGESAARGLDWSLFLSSPDERDLGETFRSIEKVAQVSPSGRLGVTIHGSRSIAEARSAFERLAGASEKRLGRKLQSYGLLVDDLHVYRAIVGQRPIGLAHPQSPAAKALADVARLIAEDAETPPHE